MSIDFQQWANEAVTPSEAKRFFILEVIYDDGPSDNGYGGWYPHCEKIEASCLDEAIKIGKRNYYHCLTAVHEVSRSNVGPDYQYPVI